MNDSDFTTEQMTDVNGTVMINDELYEVYCSCKPANPPSVMSKCYPTQIEIEFIKQFPGDVPEDKPLLDIRNLRRLLGTPEDFRIVDVQKHSYECVDGRSSNELMGTWGGDAGELMLVAATWEDMNENPLNKRQVGSLIKRYLEFMQPRYFYMNTDTRSLAWLEVEIGFDRRQYDVAWLDITRPPPELHDIISKTLLQPNATGSMLFKQMLTMPERYQIREGLVHDFIRALYAVLWDPANLQNAKIRYYILSAPEPRHESAWVDFHVGSTCALELKQAMFPPFSDGISVFVNHPQALRVRRNQTATYIQSMMGGMANLEDCRSNIQRKGKQWDQASRDAYKDLLAGLPHYSVTLHTDAG